MPAEHDRVCCDLAVHTERGWVDLKSGGDTEEPEAGAEAMTSDAMTEDRRRSPVGDEAYERTIELPDDVAADVKAGHGVIVIHGVDHNGNGEYDGDRESDLDPSLPAEATDPAACGVFEVSQMSDMPEGGVETGGGSTSGLENGGLLALSSLTIGAAAAGLVLNRRRNADPTA